MNNIRIYLIISVALNSGDTLEEFSFVSDSTRLQHEKYREGIVRTNNNLLITLFFTNDFEGKSVHEHAAMLKADPEKVIEAARILQGYGYIYIDIRDNKNILVITPKGKLLVQKMRSKLKNRE